MKSKHQNAEKVKFINSKDLDHFAIARAGNFKDNFYILTKMCTIIYVILSGPRGPPCRMDTFTAGCFCADSEQIKMYPVANNSVIEPKNICVSACDFSKCA